MNIKLTGHCEWQFKNWFDDEYPELSCENDGFYNMFEGMPDTSCLNMYLEFFNSKEVEFKITIGWDETKNWYYIINCPFRLPNGLIKEKTCYPEYVFALRNCIEECNLLFNEFIEKDYCNFKFPEI